MSDSNESLSENELKKKAYLIGLGLKNSGLDAEAVYARLEKQGIPEVIARKVAYDTIVERKKDIVREVKTSYEFALLHIGIGVGLAILSWVFFPGHVILPIGLLAGGIVAALLAKKKMEE